MEMLSIGEVVRSIRERSPYRDVKSFAEHTGLSYEGMRKIESGERIPNIQTINQIIRAVDISKEEAKAVRVARDIAHAEREDLLNRGVTDGMIEKLGTRAYRVIEAFLAECDMGFEEAEANDLRQLLVEALKEELRG